MTQAAPYLFPCVLEYSMLAIAVTYSFYADVGSLSKHTEEEREESQKKEMDHTDHTHLHITLINFHKSHKGMFSGVVIIAATCVSTVLFFSYLGQDNIISQMIYHITMICLYTLVLIVTMVATVQLHNLKYFRGDGMSVDDVMLLAAMSGSILFNILKLMPVTAMLGDGRHDILYSLSFVECVLSFFVAITQTAFLLDGMHRFTYTQEHLKKKPARGCVTFLLLANIALWLFRTFNMKEVEIEGHLQEEAFGYLAWQLFTHALIPLLIFYHYHCSACLAQIWSNSYKSDTIKNNNKPDTANNDLDISVDSVKPVSWIGPSYQNTVSSPDVLKPDKIIEFRRRGKAPSAKSTLDKIPVEVIDSPLSPISRV